MSKVPAQLVVHVGPTLPLEELHALLPGCEARPPAQRGDAIRAIDDGVDTLVIIDGVFEHTLPIWHKELIEALEAGLTVLGSSSMGALRAVELEAFGMIGVGRIVDWVRREEASDADVALIHGPAPEYRALSEPLVNVRATLERATQLGVLDEHRAARILSCADRQHYAERTWSTVLAAALTEDPTLLALDLGGALRSCAVDQKRIDAQDLCQMIADGKIPRRCVSPSLAATAFHRRMVADVRRAAGDRS